MVNLNLADPNTKVLSEKREDPNEKLWRGVLKQAFEDAFFPAKLNLCGYEKKQAMEFVTSRTRNFDSVCELAGLEPGYVWDKLNQYKKEKVSDDWKSYMRNVQW